MSLTLMQLSDLHREGSIFQSTKDKLTEAIIEIVNQASEQLETKELEGKVPTETRTKIFYRLRDLTIKGEIKGKMVGAGKGKWIWWKKVLSETKTGNKKWALFK